MKRSLLIVSALLLALKSMPRAMAQDSAPPPPAPTPSAQLQAPAEKPPIGAVSVGYLYLAAESAPGDWTWHLQGFYGIPQVNVKPWFGFIGDFVTTYNTGAGTHENVHAYLGGPIFTAKSKSKLSPFAFVTAGKVRDSNDGKVTSSPGLAAGGGLTYKLSKHVALLFVPGEYVRTYPGTGSDLNSFTARFGFVVPISR